VVRLPPLEVRTLTEDIDRDEQALVLRDQGRTYLAIAEVLDLDGARAAHAAFNRDSGCALGLNRDGCAAASWHVSMLWQYACVGATTWAWMRSSAAYAG